jgi:dihydroorotate dehydrogenase
MALSGFFNTLRPLALALPPEAAHRAAFPACRLAAALTGSPPLDPILATAVAGLTFRNPVGLAAGFDKDAEAPGALLKLGFGFVEAGTVTPKPQPGNPKPRLFRLVRDRALINRLGFNSRGFEAAAKRLSRFPHQRRSGPLGVNLGANRESKDPVADYVAGLRRFSQLADYFTVNISSPNTPGLRDLQLGKNLERLLGALQAARRNFQIAQPVFLKISPDLGQDELKTIIQEAIAHGLEGLVVSNTTLARPAGLNDPGRDEAGGLSGAPLFSLSTGILGDAFRLAGSRLALIGAGGIGSGEQAFQKILAGASLVQFYTAMVYEGPTHVRRVVHELAACLRREKFASLADAVGKGV